MPEQAAGVLLGTARGAAGWQVLVVWECETRDAEALGTRLESFLGPRS